MKTKSIGSYTYFVTKYFYTEEGTLDVEIERWSNVEYALKEAEGHEAIHGKNMASVFKSKQCIKVK